MRNGAIPPFVTLVTAGPLIDAMRAHTSYIRIGVTSVTPCDARGRPLGPHLTPGGWFP
jgi:hypothetical protein